MSNQLMIVWPKLASIAGISDIYNLVSKYADVVNKKSIITSFKGLRIVLTQVYEGESWLGDSYNHFYGTYVKGRECWQDKGIIYVFDLKGDESKILECKKVIRSISGLGNSACHTTNTNDEYVKIKAFLYNKNSLDLIKKGNLFKYKGLYEKILKYKEIIKDNPDCFVIASSTVLELYGLRKSRDIDYLTIDDSFDYNDEEIGNHLDCIDYYPCSINDLVTNPDNYIWIWGVKIISLDRLLEFKEKRMEIPKDIKDIKLIKKMKAIKNDR